MTSNRSSWVPVTWAALFLLGLVESAASASAQTAGAPGLHTETAPQAGAAGALASSTGGSSTAAGGQTAGDQHEPTDERALRIRALIRGELDVAWEPRQLFDVALDDESAIQVERVRLEALLSAVADDASAAARSGRAGAGGASGGSGGASVAPERWRARLELDRARLEFYRLSKEERDALLAAHAARQAAARPPETEEQRRAREAEAERERALAAARAARSEAERLVGEEHARLLELEQALQRVRDRFREREKELTARRDAVLGWQRRVREAKAESPAEADATYDALRRSLRVSRDELAAALDALGSAKSEVPELGPDPLGDVPDDVSTDAARAQRRRVASLIEKARAEEARLREERAAELLEEIDALNRERLGLLPHLSEGKRDQVTGFTALAWDQARSEARHLILILRYHQHVVTSWIASFRSGTTGTSYWRALAVVVPLSLLIAVFSAWRRRSPALLAFVDQRIAEYERTERRAPPSRARWVVRFLTGTHRSLEWLAFFLAAVWLLPASARALLEVQLLIVIVGWTLGGALVVNGIDTLAALAGPQSTERRTTAELRLRSLRLVGAVVVAFALILVLTSRLVGKGAIYSWVWSTCWLAAIPVFLLLVRWWRETVFERVDRGRKKTPFQAWVLANRSGWKSFLAAMLAAVHVFVLGAWKALGRWLAEFDLARRAHAYLFRRELDRLADARAPGSLQPLRDAAFAAFDPEAVETDWIACPADAVLTRLQARAFAGEGGVVALVGARGLGKSSCLRKLAASVEGAYLHDAVADSSLERLRKLVQPIGGVPRPRPRLVLMDDAHVWIKPVVRGLVTFDEAIALAGANSQTTLWVFAIDSSLWPFLQRARDARPLFDTVIQLERWSEQQIATLLTRRSDAAGITPTFEDLLEKLPPSADEIDKQEALAAKRAGYFRVIWDYSRGNPGISLEVWRRSLAEADDGSVRVRPLQVPDTRIIEALPDSALFVLRAVLQLPAATVEDIALVTHLSVPQVESAIRFGRGHGYLVEHERRVRITWRWLRAVMLLLERHRLLESKS